MFSRTERSYLALLLDGPAELAPARLEAAFPNPNYRRKLLWGIRQKTGGSLDDWRLFARAAQVEPRLLLSRGSAQEGAPPVFADPLVEVLGELRALFLGPRRNGAARRNPARRE